MTYVPPRRPVPEAEVLIPEQISVVERRGYGDALTGLPNRRAFEIALLGRHCAVPDPWAILLVELGNLKAINQAHGYATGDAILMEATGRIATTEPAAAIFRVGGNEFALLVQSADAIEDLGAVAGRILATLAQPVTYGAYGVIPRVNIGGAVVGRGDHDAESVRRNAAFALSCAREAGRGGFVQYWPGLRTRSTGRLQAIRDVDAALRQNRVVAYYQPIVRLDTREIVGLEALCRMRVGSAVVAASAFHEAAGDAHVAPALTDRMMELVAADLRSWSAQGRSVPRVGIDVSPADLQDETLADRVATTFGRADLPLTHLTLELPEAACASGDGGGGAAGLARLRERGLGVAMDHFGTNYASLTQLASMPIDTVKIDRSFIERVGSHAPSRAVVEGLIEIAAKMAVALVADGIEHDTQRALLHALGAELGQGHLFGKAASPAEVAELILPRV